MFRANAFPIERYRYRGTKIPTPWSSPTTPSITSPSGMTTWRAGCGESRTSGSEGGPGKPTSREADQGAPVRPRPKSTQGSATSRGQAVLLRDQGRLRQPDRGLLHQRPDARPAWPWPPSRTPSPAARPRATTSPAASCTRTGAASSAPGRWPTPLNRHGMVGSMGRVGSAGDNAAMESFWSLLQTNVLNQRRWRTRQELRLAIVVWIERKYHRRCPQDSLGGLTPIDYEATITTSRGPRGLDQNCHRRLHHALARGR